MPSDTPMGKGGDPPLFALLNEISIIEHLARHRLERVLPDGLRASHFVVLNHLVRLGDGRSPARIARAVQVEKPAMTNTIQKLEARGLVRVGPHPRDGRGKLVFLTEAGRAAREAGVAAATAAVAPLAAGLEEAEMLAALPTLRRLRGLLDAARDAEDGTPET
ncbi:MarR family winged helix-turn-helix transcriptional regulator [Falsiroseomonas sp. HW251]|uniref:MarR family winged helix-turn-helix transcriptional regulator n=1 Tax=Falsiroseomonas sp. HW251 TaxID=3390998 RepID=UPI003D31EDBA